MSDVHSPEIRSKNMSAIRSKDTAPEMLVRRFLHSNGFRYRLYVKDLPGKPDIVLPKYRAVIFVHGCFWHQHPGCSNATMPKTNADFWKQKLQQNIDRDARSLDLLRRAGWRCAVLWECEVQQLSRLKKIVRWLNRIHELPSTHDFVEK